MQLILLNITTNILTYLSRVLVSLINPSVNYMVIVFSESTLLINHYFFSFFRKFLTADYCWFLFASNSATFLRRTIKK